MMFRKGHGIAYSQTILAFAAAATVLTACGERAETQDARSTETDGVATEADAAALPEEIAARDGRGPGEQVVEKEAFQLDSKYCASRAKVSSYEHIASIKIDALELKTGNNSGYREDTSGRRAKPGQYAITLTPGYSYGSFTESWVVWIDLNGDGTLADGEKVFEKASVGAVTGTITIPDGAVRGKTLMRVSMRWASKPAACGTFTYGEVEDVNLTITDKPWQNEALRYDVSGDGCTAPMDLLQIVNDMNASGVRALPGWLADGGAFVDVNGDGWMTAADQLQMINKQNADGLASCSKPWQSPVDRLDVNRDGCRSPIDNLTLINAMNAGKYFNTKLPAEKPAAEGYLDPNGDGYFTSGDMLALTNAQNAGQMTGCGQ